MNTVSANRIAALQQFSSLRAADLYVRYGHEDAARVEDLLHVLLRTGEDVVKDKSGEAILVAIDALDALGRDLPDTSDKPLISHVALTLESVYSADELARIATAILAAPSREGVRAVALRTVYGRSWPEIADDLGLSARSVKARARNAANAIAASVTGRTALTGCGANPSELPKVIFGLYDDDKTRDCAAVEVGVNHVGECDACNELYISLVRACEVIGALMPPLASAEPYAAPVVAPVPETASVAPPTANCKSPAPLDTAGRIAEPESNFLPIGKIDHEAAGDLGERAEPILNAESAPVYGASPDTLGGDEPATRDSYDNDPAGPFDDPGDDPPARFGGLVAHGFTVEYEERVAPILYNWQSEEPTEIAPPAIPADGTPDDERPEEPAPTAAASRKFRDDRPAEWEAKPPTAVLPVAHDEPRPDVGDTRVIETRHSPSEPIRPRGVTDAHDPLKAVAIEVPILAFLPPLPSNYHGDDTTVITATDEFADRRERRKIAAAMAMAAALLLVVVLSVADLLAPVPPRDSHVAVIEAPRVAKVATKPRKRATHKRKRSRKHANRPLAPRYVPAVEHEPRIAPAPAPAAAPADDGRAEFLPEAG